MSLTPDKFCQYVDLLAKKYKPATVNKIINILSNMSNFCWQTYRIKLPLEATRRIATPKKKKEVWTPEQIKTFLDFAKGSGSQYYPMLVVSALTAARPGEVCGMLQDAYRPDLGGISIDSGYSKGRVKTNLKTAGSHRWLLPGQLL